ncbi:hypothetical protein ABZ619_39610 [Streptomyces sp. NPDC007851]|uniref:hypothetical protein n=1 Tax=Streptomyces sp. NPDC007851 TaxID=3155008 RepID=UPI00340CC573
MSEQVDQQQEVDEQGDGQAGEEQRYPSRPTLDPDLVGGPADRIVREHGPAHGDQPDHAETDQHTGILELEQGRVSRSSSFCHTAPRAATRAV